MITLQNYQSEVSALNLDSLPNQLREGHLFFLDARKFYTKDQDTRESIDIYLKTLNNYLHNLSLKKKAFIANISPAIQKKIKADAKQIDKAIHKERATKNSSTKMVETLHHEVVFIKRYLGFHNKTKTLSSILTYIKSLQKAIIQKLIRKSSPFAPDIRAIQNQLVNTYNNARNKNEILFTIPKTELPRYVSIVGGETIYKSIAIIKRFIGMQGKNMEAKQIDTFLKFIQKSAITKNDPFHSKVEAIVALLKKTKTGTLKISPQELNGLKSIAKECSCNLLGKIYDTNQKQLRQCKSRKYSDAGRGACSYNKGVNGKSNHLGKIYDTNQKELRPCRSKKYSNAGRGACSYNQGVRKGKSLELNGIMTASEVAALQFEKLPLIGKWKSLIGEPATNFDMMIHGEPNSGKTTFLLQFALYLASNFGSVLYVSSEEYGSATLTDKMKALPYTPNNLHFGKDLSKVSLRDYNFVILDSINDLRIDIATYKVLREESPNTAFILVLQHTKDGQFKGGKEWEHEVEIGATVANGVLTVYRNRYGVKGSMDFFNN